MDSATRKLLMLRVRILEEDILPKTAHIAATPFYARSNTRKLAEPLVATLIYLGGVYYLLFILHPVGAPSVVSLSALREFAQSGRLLRAALIFISDFIGALLLVRIAYIVILLAVRLPLNLLLQLKPELAIDTHNLDFRLLCRADELLGEIEKNKDARAAARSSGALVSGKGKVTSSTGAWENSVERQLLEKHAALNEQLLAVFPNYPQVRDALVEGPDPKANAILAKILQGPGLRFPFQQPRPTRTSVGSERKTLPGTVNTTTITTTTSSTIMATSTTKTTKVTTRTGGNDDDDDNEKIEEYEEEEEEDDDNGPALLATARSARAARTTSAHRSGVTARQKNPSSASASPESFPTTTTNSSSSSSSSQTNLASTSLSSSSILSPSQSHQPSPQNKQPPPPQISSTLRKFINYTKNNRNSLPHIRYAAASATMTKDLPLHAYIRPLTINDLDQVEALETEGFPPEERASREKLAYRLKTCPELCAGIFVREFILPTEEYRNPTFVGLHANVLQGLGLNHQYDPINATAAAAAASGQSTEEHLSKDLQSLKKSANEVSSTPAKETLIAHIHGTKTASTVVTEASMLVPDESFDVSTADTDKLPYVPGHYEPGRTIAVHGLVVKPSYQGQSLGTILLKDYIQRLSTLRIADQIALLAHDTLIPFYARQDFVDRGESTVTSCGGNWHDLVRELAYSEEYE
ncbi:uncharacterized protein SAPINGB_P005125 [Magnusiomyces paraingens]|uniref:N-acetyltransferase domain-containing protein n=1 Tax=Magnusiomyces paraingens TaxID=2606893 RepID=A0A5E8C3Z7_9ASCO|nr:uncharacterized protein SAPINGB_P005125 [Saprochaete ingens]VVT56518.1 unnamed protein product [Saprochaete ingens]